MSVILNPQLVAYSKMLFERRRANSQLFKHLNAQDHIAQTVHEKQSKAYELARAAPTEESRTYAFKTLGCYFREVLDLERVDANLIGKPKALSTRAIEANRRNSRKPRVIIDGELLDEILQRVFDQHRTCSTQELMSHIYSAMAEGGRNLKDIVDSRGKCTAIEYDYPKGTKFRPGEKVPYRSLKLGTVRNRRTAWKKSR